ncbi:MAG: TetR family transcriptional regulator [Ilumatobacteraceae bacterium]|nr:TetR family transcriptional regulator [Ilumatobacteraceae bacterium]
MARPRTADDAQVFAAIASLVSAVGPSGVTFARVGELVGVSASALAQRFGSKYGLLVAFAAQAGPATEAVFAAAARAHARPLDAIVAAMVSMVDGIDTREAMANNIAFLQLDLVDPGLRAHAVAHSRSMRGSIRRLLHAAERNGDLRATDVARLAEQLDAVYSGALVTWAIDGTGTLSRWVGTRLRRALDPYRSVVDVGG